MKLLLTKRDKKKLRKTIFNLIKPYCVDVGWTTEEEFNNLKKALPVIMDGVFK